MDIAAEQFNNQIQASVSNGTLETNLASFNSQLAELDVPKADLDFLRAQLELASDTLKEKTGLDNPQPMPATLRLDSDAELSASIVAIQGEESEEVEVQFSELHTHFEQLIGEEIKNGTVSENYKQIVESLVANSVEAKDADERSDEVLLTSREVNDLKGQLEFAMVMLYGNAVASEIEETLAPETIEFFDRVYEESIEAVLGEADSPLLESEEAEESTELHGALEGDLIFDIGEGPMVVASEPAAITASEDSDLDSNISLASLSPVDSSPGPDYTGQVIHAIELGVERVNSTPINSSPALDITRSEEAVELASVSAPTVPSSQNIDSVSSANRVGLVMPSELVDVPEIQNELLAMAERNVIETEGAALAHAAALAFRDEVLQAIAEAEDRIASEAIALEDKLNTKTKSILPSNSDTIQAVSDASDLVGEIVLEEDHISNVLAGLAGGGAAALASAAYEAKGANAGYLRSGKQVVLNPSNTDSGHGRDGSDGDEPIFVLEEEDVA